MATGRKRNENRMTGNEKTNLALLADDMIVYIENLKEATNYIS